MAQRRRRTSSARRSRCRSSPSPSSAAWARWPARWPAPSPLYAPAFFLGPVTEAIFGEFSAQVGFQLALGGLGLVARRCSPIPTGIAGAAQTCVGAAARAHRPRADRPAADAAPEPPLVVDRRAAVLRRAPGPRRRRHPRRASGRSSGSSDRTAPARRRCSTSSPARSAPTPAASGSSARRSPTCRRSSGPPFGVARSFQNARLFPGLTVTETVQVALSGRNRVGFVSSAVGAPWARALNRQHPQARRSSSSSGSTSRTGPTPSTSDLSTGTRRICDLAAQVATPPEAAPARRADRRRRPAGVRDVPAAAPPDPRRARLLDPASSSTTCRC